MSEMVERVARAIHKEEASAFIWEHSPQPIREHRRKQARAAIEAMREPTEVVTGAGAWSLTILYAAGRVDMDEKDVDLSVINCIWNAMITECLDPGTSPAWTDDSDDNLKQIAAALK